MSRKTLARRPESRSKAYLTLETNLETVKHMLDMSGRELTDLQKTIVRRGSLAKTVPSTLVDSPAMKRWVRSLNDLADAISLRVDRYVSLRPWMLVVIVTCVEAYLQDILSAAASQDPDLMEASEQCAAYSDVLVATSLEDLAGELRSRWSRNWLKRGGPTRWIKSLEQMGARGYPANLSSRMELIWGIRHVIVHSAGIVTRDFQLRHPTSKQVAGDRIPVGMANIAAAAKLVEEFVDPTDRYFLSRLPTLATKAQLPARRRRRLKGKT